MGTSNNVKKKVKVIILNGTRYYIEEKHFDAPDEDIAKSLNISLDELKKCKIEYKEIDAEKLNNLPSWR